MLFFFLLLLLKTTAAKLHNYVTNKQKTRDRVRKRVIFGKSEDLVVCKNSKQGKGEIFHILSIFSFLCLLVFSFFFFIVPSTKNKFTKTMIKFLHIF